MLPSRMLAAASGAASSPAITGVLYGRCHFSTSGGPRENYMRERDFTRWRSSLGKKHKYPKGGLENIPEKHYSYDKDFAKVASFESQMESLSVRGFRRPYKAYTPPKDFELKFMQILAKTLPAFSGKEQHDLSKMALSGDTKALVLNALSRELGGHDVPNSLVHTMNSLDKVFTFYSTPVDARTSYERMEAAAARGEGLPPNLHVQLDPFRFNPDEAKAQGNTSPLATVTAYPRSSTILSTPEARKRYGKGYQAKHDPWVNVPESNQDEKFDH